MKFSNILILLTIILTISLWPFSFLLNNGFHFKPEKGTIFETKRDERQLIIQKGYLYPSVFLSRLFQNKTTVVVNKFEANFFTLIDPNNYFFHLHPREILIDNQNLDKFPFLAIIFFLLGLYQIPKHKLVQKVALVFLAEVILLSFLKNLDKWDVIVYPPVAFITIFGLISFTKKLTVLKLAVLAIFIVFSLTEYLHVLAQL